MTYNSQYNVENVKHCQHLSFLSSNSSDSAHVMSIDIINTEVVIHTKAGNTGINIEISIVSSLVSFEGFLNMFLTFVTSCCK